MKYLLQIAVLLFPCLATAEADAAASYDFNVPVADARGETQTYVRFRAADVSTTGIALVVYGGNDEMWSAAEKAITDARLKDIPCGLVIADGDPAIDVFISGVQVVPGEGAPVEIAPENRDKSYYYRAAMSAALEAYKKHTKEAERRKE